MKALGIPVRVAGVVLVLTLAGQAHHSAVTFYDVDQIIEVTGVVKEIQLRSPHTFFRLEVTDENGETAIWTIEGGSANSMRAASIEAGESLTVAGSPARNPEATAMVAWRMVKADGSVIEGFGGRGRPEEFGGRRR